MNKIDMVPAEARARTVKRFLKDLGWKGKSFIISALTGEGCRELAFAVMKHLELQKTQTPADTADAGATRIKARTRRRAG